MNLVTNNFRYASGQIAAGQLVNVYLRGTTTKPPIFQDEDGTVSLPNPLRTDAVGNLWFYIDPGEYDFVAYDARVPFDVLVFDASGVADLADDLTDHIAATADVHGIVDAVNLDARTAIAGVSPLQWYLNGKA